MFERFIAGAAPSGTLLGLLQRGRGDGTLHALAAPRAEALDALYHCVCSDPRRDWQVENRSLYYARLCLELDAGLGPVEEHLFAADDLISPDEQRCGLALSVLGHLAGYGRTDAVELLRRYAAGGGCWQWALDELALRDDDASLRALAPAVLGRFPETGEGEQALAEAVKEAFEPRPWMLWADDPVYGPRVRAAQERRSFDRWQRQLNARGPRPDWSVTAVLAWADEIHDPAGEEGEQQRHFAAAARCLAAVAGDEDRPELVAAALHGTAGARAAAIVHLASAGDPDALDLIEAAAESGSDIVADAAFAAFGRMCSIAALDRARIWAARADDLGTTAAVTLACRGAATDAPAVRTALLRTVRDHGPDADALWALTEGAGRLRVADAAPVLRHIYRETTSSQLRGHAATALATTDPSFAAGFAVECLWDCEESTREIAARYAETADARVVAQLRRLAADPAEEDGVQDVVRTRITPDGAGS
ncbi:HEAT repeat domain-containing protein [Streptomyces boninensis]|uniref:HEAT repeat domain-containing protein n=1 Tax=Streptomyces boninensis TaxID=2039455 RepID=UPI003B21C10D